MIEPLIFIMTADETLCLFKIPLERFASAELLSFKRFISSIPNDTLSAVILFLESKRLFLFTQERTCRIRRTYLPPALGDLIIGALSALLK